MTSLRAQATCPSCRTSASSRVTLPTRPSWQASLPSTALMSSSTPASSPAVPYPITSPAASTKQTWCGLPTQPCAEAIVAAPHLQPVLPSHSHCNCSQLGTRPPAPRGVRTADDAGPTPRAPWVSAWPLAHGTSTSSRPHMGPPTVPLSLHHTSITPPQAVAAWGSGARGRACSRSCPT